MIDYLQLLDPSIASIISAVIKLLVWVVPVFMLIKLVEKRDPFLFLGLKVDFRKGMVWAFVTSLILVLYFTLQNLLFSQNEMDFNLGFNKWLNVVILVGITEEIVFRGFLLRKLMQQLKFWKANTITALLFVTIHFPIWFKDGLFENPGILFTFIQVFIVGFIFGVIYKKSNSLWSVIIIHSVYNFCVLVFY